jgi:hypothetical protein
MSIAVPPIVRRNCKSRGHLLVPGLAAYHECNRPDGDAYSVADGVRLPPRLHCSGRQAYLLQLRPLPEVRLPLQPLT